MEDYVFWVLWIVVLILIYVLFVIPTKNKSQTQRFKWQYKKWINGGGLMTKRNCNNCKFEPDWSEWRGKEYPRCSGKCKYPMTIPILPSVYRIQHSIIEKYSNGSGTMEHCPTWTRRIKRREKIPVKTLGKMIDKMANENGRGDIFDEKRYD